MRTVAVLALLVPALALGEWKEYSTVDQFDQSEVKVLRLVSTDGDVDLAVGCKRGDVPLWLFNHKRTLYHEVSAGHTSVPLRLSVDGKPVENSFLKDWEPGSTLRSATSTRHRSLVEALNGERLIIRVRLGTGSYTDAVFDIRDTAKALASLDGFCKT